MRKSLISVLFILVLLLTSHPAVSALEDEEMAFESLSMFSEGFAWVRFEDRHAEGIGVVNTDFELVYAFNETAAQSACRREGGEPLHFETAPFRDGISYIQAEGYGYVILNDEGDELASGISTARRQPYIMARGEDYFLIREYDALDECWYVYAVNAHGKTKGKRVRFSEKPEYRYIGEHIYLGTSEDPLINEVFFSENEKRTYRNDVFFSADFYGFDEDGNGFVFLDGTYDKAYLISKDALNNTEKLETWAEDPAWFDADEAMVDLYGETAGCGMFFRTSENEYADFMGETVAELPEFQEGVPVSVGRFYNGTAPVLLRNQKDVYYVTYIDAAGNAVYEPVKIGKTRDGELPVLTDRFITDGEAEAENGTTFILYGNGMFAAEAGEMILVVRQDGSKELLPGEGLCGIDGTFVYLKEKVLALDGSPEICRVSVSKETQEADQDWLIYAKFAGIYQGSDGTILILFADGTGHYREPQSTTHEDLKAGVDITYDIQDGKLTVYQLAYPIFADVFSFDGSMLMLADDPGWHDETFTRLERDQEVPLLTLMQKPEGIPDEELEDLTRKATEQDLSSVDTQEEDPESHEASGDTGEVSEDSQEQGTGQETYAAANFSFDLPEFWKERGVTVEIPEENCLEASYRGLSLISIYVIPAAEYTGGDPATYCAEKWDIGNGRYVVLWVNNWVYDVCCLGEITAYDGDKVRLRYTDDADLADILYTITGKQFDISRIRGKLDYENPNADVQDAMTTEQMFIRDQIIPAVTVH